MKLEESGAWLAEERLQIQEVGPIVKGGVAGESPTAQAASRLASQGEIKFVGTLAFERP